MHSGARQLLMLLLTLTLSLTSLPAQPTSDWSRLKDLTPGSELRIYRQGSPKPLEARFGEIREDHLVILRKDEETSIPRTEIDRIDWRASKPAVKRETVTSTDPRAVPGSQPPDPRRRTGGPSGSTSSTVTFRGKGRFETVYLRSR